VSFDDGLADRGVQLAQLHVGLGGGALDDAQRPDDRQRLLLPADPEVAERPFRLRAPVDVVPDFDRAEGVGFSAVGHGGPSGVAGRCAAV
jgi:hypothetical protein